MLIIFSLYILTILGIGLVAYFSTRNLQDYMLAGRSLGSTMTALGAGAADMSGWLILAVPGFLLTFGLHKLWIPIGLLIGAYLNWHFVAKRLRVYTETLGNVLTIPEYLHKRFADPKGGMRFCIAVVVLIFFTVYAASSFTAATLILQISFDISYHQGLFLGALIIICYTLLGGFLALNWIDLFQGGMMLLALLIVPSTLIFQAGNFETVVQNITVINSDYLNLWHNISTIDLVSHLTWGLGYFGQLHILVRFMAIKKSQDITKAKYIGMTWMLLAISGAALTGFVAINTDIGKTITDPNTIFLSLAKELFSPYIAGFLIAAALSAVMSTAAALLLASASAVTADLYHGCFKKNATSKELIIVARLAVIIIAIVALVIAHSPESSLLDLVQHAWSGLGASFGPIILLSLFWSRMTLIGAISGMLVGSIIILIWPLDFMGIYTLMPAFILSVITIIIVSLLDTPPSKQILQDFAKMQQNL